MLNPAVEAFRTRSTGVLDRVRPYWLQPWAPLALLALVQWGLVLRLALVAKHNGWIYYQGGDETFLYSSSWVVGHGHIPDSAVGFVWPMLLAPLADVAGPNFVSAIPVMILVQALVLLPLGLLAIYGCGTRIGGRVVGYLAAAIWVLAPHVTTLLFTHSYHPKWTDLTLPQALGLSGMGDFPSMVVLTCAAYFVLRLLDEGRDVDALVAAVLIGLAIGLKPANAIVLGGVLPALVVARRWRGSAFFALGLAPALLTLLLWKERGLGQVPLLSSSPVVREAAAFGAAPVVAGLRTYVHPDWHRYSQTIVDLREVFASRRMLEFLPFAGLVAVARSSWAKAAFLGGWFWFFFLLKIPRASVDDASIWRLLTPAWPAFLLLLASLPLLLPAVGGRLAALGRTWRSGGPERITRRLAIPLGIVAGLPLLLVLVLTPLHSASAARLEDLDLYVTQDPGIHVQSKLQNGKVTLTWTGGGSGNAKVFFHVLRAHRLEPVLQGVPPFPNAKEGLLCNATQKGGYFQHSGPARCSLHMSDIAGTADRTFVDKPGPGNWVYRIAVGSNWRNDASQSDLFTFSAPVRVKLRR